MNYTATKYVNLVQAAATTLNFAESSSSGLPLRWRAPGPGEQQELMRRLRVHTITVMVTRILGQLFCYPDSFL